MAADVPNLTLNSGIKMPAVGIGYDREQMWIVSV